MLFDAVVEVKSFKTNTVKKIEVDQETGRYVGVIKVEDDEELMVTVKSKDYAFNSSYVTAKEELIETPQSLDFKMQAIEENKAFRINNIHFESDAFELNQQAKNILNSFVEFMILNPTIELAIHGHTDNVGDSESNQILSSKRAQKVHDYLLEMGLSSQRLSYEGYGEGKPIVPNDTEENKAINRRTEFFILKK
jgi:outer membrane protein OmpA-like peptidoglycan-associated protein